MDMAAIAASPSQVEIKHLLACLCIGQKEIIEIHLRGGGGFWINAGIFRHFPVKFLRGDFYTVFFIMHAIHGNIIWNDADVVSFLLLLCDVAGAVAEHTKFHKNQASDKCRL